MRRGFTFAEMLATMTVLTVIAVAVVPDFEHSDRLSLKAAADILTSDIELARVMTMGDPQNPTVIGFSNTGTSYWLAPLSSAATPIVREDTGEAYFVQFGTGRAATAAGIAFTLSGMVGTSLEFDAHGALDDFTATPVVRLQVNDEWIDLTVSPTTGSITQTWGEDTGDDAR